MSAGGCGGRVPSPAGGTSPLANSRHRSPRARRESRTTPPDLGGSEPDLAAAQHVYVDVIEMAQCRVRRIAGRVGVGPPALGRPAGRPDHVVVDDSGDTEAVGIDDEPV